MMIGSLDVAPWDVILATEPVYILIGFLLSLLLGRVYDRLVVGPGSFGRTLAITVGVSCAAGVLWNVIYHYYRHLGAAAVHSVIIGAPSRLAFRPEWILDGALVHGVLPLFGWSLVHLGLQYNIALREQREQALRAMAAARDAQLRMLAYQLNPHFLFNTLNSISSLIVTRRNEDAEQMTNKLSSFLRASLTCDPGELIPLEEELALIEEYLDIEAVRFGNRLNVEIDCSCEAGCALIPGFLVQPLVENAIKHGVAPSREPVTIRLCASIEAGQLCVTVENCVPSETAPPAIGAGVGLANVRQRLAAVFGAAASLSTELKGRCHIATICIPGVRSSC
jgi:signal transduction histidine kinase